MDQTSFIEPKGGINKDTLTSNHGFLHNDAANLAIAATRGLLEEIRAAAGDRPFLECVRGSAPVPPCLSPSHPFALPPPGCWESPNAPVALWDSSRTPPRA